MNMKSAFTLVELLMVIAIIALLAALLFPVLGGAKARANRIACVNNLKQINASVLMYAHDNADVLPLLPKPDPYPNGESFFFKELTKSYAGLGGPPRQGDRLFICPSETTSPTDGLPSSAYIVDYNDYYFSSDLVGEKLSATKNPTVTVLVTEYTGCVGYSWHRPQSKYVLVNNWPDAQPYLHDAYNNALNEVSFADGHINYIKIYNDGISISCLYDPIPGYDYQWNGS